jgi:hypothetical protein
LPLVCNARNPAHASRVPQQLRQLRALHAASYTLSSILNKQCFRCCSGRASSSGLGRAAAAAGPGLLSRPPACIRSRGNPCWLSTFTTANAFFYYCKHMLTTCLSVWDVICNREPTHGPSVPSPTPVRKLLAAAPSPSSTQQKHAQMRAR